MTKFDLYDDSSVSIQMFQKKKKELRLSGFDTSTIQPGEYGEDDYNVHKAFEKVIIKAMKYKLRQKSSGLQ